MTTPTTTTTPFSHALHWVRRHVEAGRLPVGVIGIASADKVLALEAFGTDAGRTAHVDDRFALYSVTKPLSALTAMRQVQRGLLTTDTPLGRALPGIPAAQATLQNLLSHTSGISDVVLGEPQSLRQALERAPLDFVTGTARRYNNLAWEGVAALVEEASGRSFHEEFAAMVAEGGAQTLDFDETDAHAVHGEEVEQHDHAALMRLRHPAAGAIGSVGDLLSIGRSLLRGDGAVVTPATLRAMVRPRTEGLYVIDADPMKVHEHFGLGFTLPRRPGLVDHSVFGHAGWTSTQFWISPDAGLVLALGTNRLDTARSEVAIDVDELLNAVFAAPSAAPFAVPSAAER